MCDNLFLFSNTQGNILHTHSSHTSHPWLSDHPISAHSDIPHPFKRAFHDMNAPVH